MRIYIYNFEGFRFVWNTSRSGHMFADGLTEVC